MKDFRPRLQFRSSLVLSVIAALTAAPVMASSANFATLSLAPGFESTKGTVEGYTGGSYSLSAISNRDRDKNACIGFADPKPDHLMILEKDFSGLNIRVNSGGKDTTLLIQGPDETIRCGDDTGRRKDASIDGTNWKAGTYKIWVGTFNSGDKGNYTLRVEQP